MINLSTMKNIPVICGEKKAGILQSVCLDKEQKQVSALMISCGFKGKRIVPAHHILSISDGFILVKETARYKRKKEADHLPLVRDSSGMLVGRVIDYAIDEDTLRVCALEMIPGYLPFEFRKRIWVFEYCRLDDAIIVSAELCNEPILLGRGE